LPDTRLLRLSISVWTGNITAIPPDDHESIKRSDRSETALEWFCLLKLKRNGKRTLPVNIAPGFHLVCNRCQAFAERGWQKRTGLGTRAEADSQHCADTNLDDRTACPVCKLGRLIVIEYLNSERPAIQDTS
jgi:hypothetical protein